MGSDRSLSGCVVGTMFLVVLIMPGVASALILVIPGDQPWHNGSTPQGSEPVANLPGRIGGWEGPPFGGGEYHFSYECEDTEEFSEALRVFAAIRAPRRELVVHDGPGRDAVLPSSGPGQKRGLLVDWTFTVWVPENFHRLYNNPTSHFSAEQQSYRQPVPAPRIDVYLREDSPIDWAKVHVPDRITVIDRRASAAPVKPEDGSVVEVNVYDMATGRPIPDAVLRISRSQSAASQPAPASQPEEEPRATGDEDGRILLKNIPRGAFNGWVEAPGYAPRSCLWINDEVPTYHGLDVELSKAATISGTVTDEQGKPIQGVAVIAWQIMGIDGRGYGRYYGHGEPSAETDDAGRFQIYPLPKGYAGLRCRSDSHYAPLVPLMAVPAEGVQIKMTGTGTVRGRVSFPEGRPGPDEVHVSISPPGNPVGKWGGSMRCNDDKSFEFTGVPPGEYFLRCPAATPGRAEDGVRVIVKPGETADVVVPYR